ncbi:dTMP kinase [Psychromonas sp. CNPT3]|uniref:dTMP kinase n=1 Tax=Psychromonas sp. CNPT3 TaxID=314282 RepID=UPI00006E809A|nr:dTMP kinase [Psychromonas sp. CNPT3]AGH80763.1 dTMP kinase [Psychromonas sp. CNPT3]
MSAQKKLENKFIVIEGLEGAGKTTAIRYIGNWLAEQGVPTSKMTYTREPGGTKLGEYMRDIIKMDLNDESLDDKAELLLMYASRVQLVEAVIKPALAQGHIVIGDRHNYSSLAYQGGGRGLDMHFIHSLKQLSLGDFKADFTLYLDIDPALGLQRARGRGELDRIERLAIDFFERTRQVFLNLVADDESAVTIDASKTPAQVEKAIFKQLDNWLVSLK